jgi:hypothetical protein
MDFGGHARQTYLEPLVTTSLTSPVDADVNRMHLTPVDAKQPVSKVSTVRNQAPDRPETTDKETKRRRAIMFQPRQPQRQPPINYTSITPELSPSKELLEAAATEEQRLLQEAMNRAEVSTDPSTGEKETNYPCSGCDAVFNRIYNLKSHMRSHLTVRPYKCTYCIAAFSRNHDLSRYDVFLQIQFTKINFQNRHMRIHDKIKPFSCKYCGKLFSRRDALKRHEKMDAQGKRSRCSFKGIAQFESQNDSLMSPYTFSHANY